MTPKNDKQQIGLEPIYDADTSVYFDMDAKRQDKSDAKYCFVISSMTPEDYRETYDDDPQTWPKAVTENTYFDWSRADVVYVAEYYTVSMSTYEVFCLCWSDWRRGTVYRRGFRDRRGACAPSCSDRL